MNKKPIYADHSATTRVRPEVVEAMKEVLEVDFGNPSSIHSFGRKAKKYLNEARANISAAINANEDKIYFTSGGTESNNTVIFGATNFFESRLNNLSKDKHLIVSKIEHSSVKEPFEYLEKKGWKVSWINVDNEGFVSLDELKNKITAKTFLVSIIYANNEIGTIQNLKKISEICQERSVLLHTDAVQAFAKIPINVKECEIDFITFSSHKIYGPKGIGAVYAKSNLISPVLVGGGQENNLRAGTENLPGIVGFGLAAKLLNCEIIENTKMLRKYQIALMESFQENNNVVLTGPGLGKVKENVPHEKFIYRLPGHVSFCCKGIEGESLVLQLDLKGIAVSSASACKSNEQGSITKVEPSHVLKACSVPQEYIKGSLRLTLGRENTEEEVFYVKDVINQLCSNKFTSCLR